MDNESLFAGLVTPENLLMLGEHIKETEDAVRDIPACLELIARATLARAFVIPQKQPNGEISIDFEMTKFEQVWAYLAQEEPPENPQN